MRALPLALPALLLALAGCETAQRSRPDLPPLPQASAPDATLWPAPTRDMADAYLRAGRPEAAKAAYDALAAEVGAEAEVTLERAMLAARLDQWDEAASLAASLPGGDSARRAMLEAMMADRAQDWAAADAAYARTLAQGGRRSHVLNNWGVSRMARGDLPAAAESFAEAIAADPSIFATKNNLAIARALQGDYRLPMAVLTEEERAILLNNMGLAALRRGETETARRLLAEAVATHPRHYRSAADRLAALAPTI